MLAFLSEMLHPLVRRGDGAETATLAEAFNEILRPDGWELVPGKKKVGGLPLWSARPLAAERRVLADAAEEIVDALSSANIARQIQRMEASIDTDPDLAIGTAKEFVESVAKAILEARLIEYDPKLTSTGSYKRSPKSCALHRRASRTT